MSVTNPLAWDRIAARVRGLTLTRPWPWAFASAGKRVENRSWRPPSYCALQWIALHAGQGFDREVIELFRAGEFGDLALAVPEQEHEHPKGAIVALARIGDVTYLDAEDRSPDRWAFGPVVWCFDRVLILREPVPCRGFQGLWRPPAAVLELLRVAVVDDAPTEGSTP